MHVVGTNGKSTATRTIAALLRSRRSRRRRVHVAARERLARAPRHRSRTRSSARSQRSAARPRRSNATQFEALTAAALADFAERGVDAAVVEAGLGGRLDATNVIDAPVVLLTNVGLEHTDVLGETREEIAREKLAVAKPGAIVVLPDDEWRDLVPDVEIRLGGAREAAEAFVGHPIEAEVEVALPGPARAARPDEVRDGAHTPEAVDWLLERLEPRDWTIVASILGDKDVDGMLERLAAAGHTLIATTQQQSARARRAEPRGPRRTVFRACGGSRRPGRRPSSGHASSAPFSSPARSTSLPISTTRSRTEKCARPGGSGSRSSPSRSRSSRGSSACRSPLAT